MKQQYYFYNFVQIDFFIKNNIQPIGAGIGREGDPFVIFPKDTESKKVFDRWCKLCDKYKGK